MRNGEPKDPGNVVLSDGWGIEKENLRLGSIDKGARSIRESIKDGFIGEILLDWRVAEKHVVVNKLLMGGGRRAMNWDAPELLGLDSLLDKMT